MSPNFKEDVMLVDKELSVPLLDGICRSILACSILCLQTTGCIGFSFRKKAGVCRLHDNFLTLKTVLGNRVWRATQCYGYESRWPSVYCSASCYCLKVVNVGRTWHDAKAHCAAEGTYLLKVGTKDQLEFALEVMDKHTDVSYIWVGGYKETTSDPLKWLDGTLIDTSLLTTENIGTSV